MLHDPPTLLANSWPTATDIALAPIEGNTQDFRSQSSRSPFARISRRGSSFGCHLLESRYLRLSGDEPRLRERYWGRTVPSVWEYCPGCMTAGRSGWEEYRSSNIAARDVYGNSGSASTP